jgi:hypothetical protein
LTDARWERIVALPGRHVADRRHPHSAARCVLWKPGPHNTRIGDQTSAAIAGHKDIHSLKLNDTKITDAGLARLAGMRVTSLGLNGTGINGTGLKLIAVLQYLDLSNSR